MGKLKRFIGYSAYMGNKRKLDEYLGRKEIFQHQIDHKIREWKECIECMPEIDAKIAELEAIVAREDAE